MTPARYRSVSFHCQRMVACFLACGISRFVPLAHLCIHHVVPFWIPLGEQDEDALPHEPRQKGHRQPAPAPVREDDEPYHEPQAGPAPRVKLGRPADENALPDTAQDGDMIAVYLLGHQNVAPAT